MASARPRPLPSAPIHGSALAPPPSSRPRPCGTPAPAAAGGVASPPSAPPPPPAASAPHVSGGPEIGAFRPKTVRYRGEGGLGPMERVVGVKMRGLGPQIVPFGPPMGCLDPKLWLLDPKWGVWSPHSMFWTQNGRFGGRVCGVGLEKRGFGPKITLPLPRLWRCGCGGPQNSGILPQNAA